MSAFLRKLCNIVQLCVKMTNHFKSLISLFNIVFNFTFLSRVVKYIFQRSLTLLNIVWVLLSRFSCQI